MPARSGAALTAVSNSDSQLSANPTAAMHRPPTPFELRLHEVCKRVPAGKVSTYGALAKVLKSSPRAVGQALRRNPYAPKVPCHRIVASSLELGGFSGSWGLAAPNVQRKKLLLQKEGVKFDAPGVVSKDVVMTAEDF